MFIQVMILHEHKTQRLFRNLSSEGNNLNLMKNPFRICWNLKKFGCYIHLTHFKLKLRELRNSRAIFKRSFFGNLILSKHRCN